MKKFLSIFLSTIIIAALFAGMAIPANASKKSSVKKKLTSTKWECYTCNGPNGVQAPIDYYGHQPPHIFSLRFKKNNTFKCVLGAFVFYKGTYKISKKGKVTLRVKKRTDGISSYKVNKSLKLKTSKNFKTISFKYRGIRNKFKKKWW